MIEARRKAVPTGPAHGGYDAVIFDMDGTLVEPMLDFAAIRAELGVPAGVGILEGIETMPPDRQGSAHRVLLDYELAAARRAQPMHGAIQTLQAVRAAGLKTALLTRNAAAAMAEVISRLGWRFDLAWSREQGRPQAYYVRVRQWG